MAKKPTVIDGVVIPEDLIAELDAIVKQEVDEKVADIDAYIESGELDRDIANSQE